MATNSPDQTMCIGVELCRGVRFQPDYQVELLSSPMGQVRAREGGRA